jgi:alkaline phosphatase
MTTATRAGAALALILASTSAFAQEAAAPTIGNVVFFHPDGTGVNHWLAARVAFAGPDGELNWDRLPGIGVYTGHLSDRLTGTSHGGATIHAYGVKVQADSFGLDGTEEITALSGQNASIAEEAMAAGRAVALVNSGAITEPGTAAFVASSPSRGDHELISAQVIESGAQIILSGGEQFLLPEGVAGRHGEGSRTDGRNLIEEAIAAGFQVVYTRDELMALDPATVDRVLGVFALNDTFNDQEFERNAIEGLPHYVETAPTVYEMTQFALAAVADDPEGFFVIVEEEGTDNMANSLNAAGTLEALRRADETVGVIHRFVEERGDTLLVLAADSDAGGLQVVTGSDIQEGEAVPATTDGGGIVMGQQGHFGDAFMSAPDANGVSHPFALGFIGYDDVAGGILVRAAGINADRVEPLMDNTEVYRLMYETMFGPIPAQ